MQQRNIQLHLKPISDSENPSGSMDSDSDIDFIVNVLSLDPKDPLDTFPGTVTYFY